MGALWLTCGGWCLRWSVFGVVGVRRIICWGYMGCGLCGDWFVCRLMEIVCLASSY